MIKNCFRRKKQNKFIYFLIILLIVYVSVLPLQAFSYNVDKNLIEDLNDSIVEELDNINFNDLNDLIYSIDKENSNYFSIDNIKTKIYSILSGEDSINFENFFAYLFSNIIDIALSYLPALSVLVAIGVIGNLLDSIKSKFGDKSTHNLINVLCFLSVASILIGIIANLSNKTSLSITNMVKQMNVIFPILLTLIIGLGNTATAGVFQPIVSILTTFVADAFNYFILPLFLLSFAFNIISNLSDTVKFNKFSSFLNSLFKWSVGIIFTLFFAIMTIQGITAGSFDGIGIRTTKYTIKSYVPIMGGYISDGMDLILSSSLLIKNTLGLVGILLVVSVVLSPILEIVIVSLLFKLASATLEPLGSKNISNFLSSSASTITILSTSLIAISFMYVISVGLIMTSSMVIV